MKLLHTTLRSSEPIVFYNMNCNIVRNLTSNTLNKNKVLFFNTPLSFIKNYSTSSQTVQNITDLNNSKFGLIQEIPKVFKDNKIKVSSSTEKSLITTKLHAYITKKIIEHITKIEKENNFSPFHFYRLFLETKYKKSELTILFEKIGLEHYGSNLENLSVYQKKGLLYDFITLGPEIQINKIIQSNEIKEHSNKHELIYKVLALFNVYKEKNKISRFNTKKLFKYMHETLNRTEYYKFYQILLESDISVNSGDQGFVSIRRALLNGSIREQRLITLVDFFENSKGNMPLKCKEKLLSLHSPYQIFTIIMHLINQERFKVDPDLIKTYIFIFNERATVDRWTSNLSNAKKSELHYLVCLTTINFMLKNSINSEVVSTATAIIKSTLQKMKIELPQEEYKTQVEKLCMVVLTSFSNHKHLTEPLLKFTRDICFKVLNKDSTMECSESFKKMVFSKFNNLLLNYLNKHQVLFKFYEKLDPAILEVCNVLHLLRNRKYQCQSDIKKQFQVKKRQKKPIDCKYIDNAVLNGWYQSLIIPRTHSEKKLRELFDYYLLFVQKQPTMTVDESVLNQFITKAIIDFKNNKLAYVFLKKFMTDIPKEKLKLTHSNSSYSSFLKYVTLYCKEPFRFDSYIRQVCELMDKTGVENSGTFVQKVVMKYLKMKKYNKAKVWYDLLLEKEFRLTNPFVVVLAVSKKWPIPEYVDERFIEICKMRVIKQVHAKQRMMSLQTPKPEVEETVEYTDESLEDGLVHNDSDAFNEDEAIDIDIQAEREEQQEQLSESLVMKAENTLSTLSDEFLSVDSVFQNDNKPTTDQ